MRIKVTTLLFIFSAAIATVSARADIIPLNSVSQQLSGGLESLTTTEIFGSGSPIQDFQNGFSFSAGYTYGAFGYGQAGTFISAYSFGQPTVASVFVEDVIHFEILGPTSQVAIHVSVGGDVYAEGDPFSTGNDFTSLVFYSDAYQDNTESLSKLNVWHSESSPYGSDSFDLEQDYLADTNVLYTAYLLVGTSAMTSNLGYSDVSLFADGWAEFSVSSDAPNARDYTIITAVPEPSTFGILGAASLLACATLRKRFRFIKR